MTENSQTTDGIREEVINVLRTVYDPEIPVNIYDLGLIYEVKVDENNDVDVTMTFTSPACPTAGQILNEVNYRSSAVEGVNDVRIKVTWDPPWDKSMVSERARAELSQLFGEF
jgi:FeS assembly SUF system protein